MRSRRVARFVIIGAALFAVVAAFVGAELLTRSTPRDSLEAGDESAASPTEGALPARSDSEAPAAIANMPAEDAEQVQPTLEPSGADGTDAEQHTSDASATTRTQSLFGKSISFKDALEKQAHLSREEATLVVDALTGVLDFRRSQPTDSMTIERRSSGELVRLEYRSGLTQRYEVVRNAQGKLEGKQIEVPIRITRVEKGGTIRGSLGDALEGLSLGRSLAGVFSEVFEGQVNFSTDTREGDSFRIILDEEHVDGAFYRYGAVHSLEYRGSKAGTLQAFWHEGREGDGDFYDASGRALHGGWLRTPLRYDHISSGYGMRVHPVLKRRRLHNGVDYAAGSGTAIRAAAAGEVIFAGDKGPNGNLLAIAHASGYETYYAHLSRFAPGIKKGVKVKQRQLVAYVGSTGRSTGPHLHFSLKRHGRFLDPMSQLNGPGLPMPRNELPAYKRRVQELSATLSRIPLVAPKPVQTPTPRPDDTDLGEEEL